MIRKPVLYGGIAAMVIGLALLVWGLAPAKGFSAAGGAFGGGSVPPDLEERLNAAMAGLQARVWADAVGFVLLLGGFVALKAAKVPDPEPEVLRQVAVEAEAKRRHDPAGSPDKADIAGAPVAEPLPAEAPPVRPPGPTGPGTTRCPECDGPLIASGRFCVVCR